MAHMSVEPSFRSFAACHVAGPIRRLQWLLIAATTLLLMLPGRAVTPFIAFLVLCALISEVWLSLREKRLRALLHTEEDRVCLACGGRLESRRAEGACPRCGHEYVAAKLPSLWESMEF